MKWVSVPPCWDSLASGSRKPSGRAFAGVPLHWDEPSRGSHFIGMSLPRGPARGWERGSCSPPSTHALLPIKCFSVQKKKVIVINESGQILIFFLHKDFFFLSFFPLRSDVLLFFFPPAFCFWFVSFPGVAKSMHWRGAGWRRDGAEGAEMGWWGQLLALVIFLGVAEHVNAGPAHHPLPCPSPPPPIMPIGHLPAVPQRWS